jgi:hypothetical protein
MKKKILPLFVASGMVLGTVITTPNPFVESKVEASSVKYVAPQEIEPHWVTGDYVDSIGNRFPNAAKSVGFKTEKAEKGTLVLEIRRNKFCEGCWENYRITDRTIPVDMYAEPYLLDGRTEQAERATTKSEVVEKMNVNSKADYYIRVTAYIDKVDSDHSYYLGMMGSNDPNSFHIKAWFYPSVDLTTLSKNERDRYFKGETISEEQPNTPNTDKTTHIGRILIKSSDVVLYNQKGLIHRKLKVGEGLRVYKVENDRFQVGGGYYVKKSKNTLFYVGHVYSPNKYMYVYSPDGKIYKKYQPKQTVRVYEVKNGRYQVGGGYYVIPADHIKFDR